MKVEIIRNKDDAPVKVPNADGAPNVSAECTVTVDRMSQGYLAAVMALHGSGLVSPQVIPGEITPG